EELACTYHRVYDSGRLLPTGDQPVTALTWTRLCLVKAPRTVLAYGLDLLGVTAPDRMWRRGPTRPARRCGGTPGGPRPPPRPTAARRRTARAPSSGRRPAGRGPGGPSCPAR